MQILEDRILKEGHVKSGGILKVGSFLNHQMDIGLFNQMGREFFMLFSDEHITKILTIEASGIGIACIAAQYFNIGNGDGSGGIWKDLEDLGGGFNVTQEALHDKEKRTKIAAKIRGAGDCLDEVVRILQEYLLEVKYNENG
jgi:xanthine phosphoribosyltransferase